VGLRVEVKYIIITYLLSIGLGRDRMAETGMSISGRAGRRATDEIRSVGAIKQELIINNDMTAKRGKH